MQYWELKESNHGLVSDYLIDGTAKAHIIVCANWSSPVRGKWFTRLKQPLFSWYSLFFLFTGAVAFLVMTFTLSSTSVHWQESGGVPLALGVCFFLLCGIFFVCLFFNSWCCKIQEKSVIFHCSSVWFWSSPDIDLFNKLLLLVGNTDSLDELLLWHAYLSIAAAGWGQYSWYLQVI